MDDSTPLSAKEAAQELNGTVADISLAALRTWADALKPRSDMENAVQTLGRLRAIAGVDADAVKIDLREANLQGIDFEGGNFNGARLNDAQLQGADLQHAWMQRTDLEHAQMQGADLGCARMKGADLWQAHMQRAILWNAQMQGAILSHSQLQGAKISFAEFDAEFSVYSSDFTGAAIWHTDLSPLRISAEQLNTAFGDGSVTLPDHIDWPAHWPRETLDDDEFEKQWRAFQATLPPGWDRPKR